MGSGFVFMEMKMERKKKVPTTKLVLQFVRVRELFSFSGLPGNSGSLPKAVRIPPSRGWDKR